MSCFWSIAGAFSCALCTAVGAIGNGMTIALFVKFEKFRNPVGYFILSLAVTDFLSSLTTTTGNTYFFASDFKWHTDFLWCVLYRVVTYGNFTASTFLIFLISVNRCVKICYSVEIYQKIYSSRNIVAMIFLALAVPYALHILAVVNLGGILIHDVENGNCALKLNNKTYAVLLTVYFLMTSIAIICYTKIYIKYKKATDAGGQPGQNHNQNRLLKMLVVTSIAFAACFLIPLLFGLSSKIFKKRPKMPVEHFLFKVLSSFGILMNPIIYGVLNQQYRAAYAMLLCKSSFCHPSSNSRKETNTTIE